MDFFEIKLELSLFQNLQRLKNFIRSLTPVFVNFVEGNHRFQTALHFLFGYDIRKPYPQFRPTLAEEKVIPEGSTLRRTTQLQVFFSLYEDENEAIERFQHVSNTLQSEKTKAIDPTLKDVFTNIYRKILEHKDYPKFHENAQQFKEDKRDLTKEEQTETTTDPFLIAHNAINNIIFHEVTGSDSTLKLLQAASYFKDEKAKTDWLSYTEDVNNYFQGYRSYLGHIMILYKEWKKTL